MFVTEPVLKVNRVSKKFGKTISASKRILRGKLKQALFATGKELVLDDGEFYALRNVSFELYKGQALGVIGLNGSGKSTLLKIIYGLSLPDEGTVEVNGEVGGIIELGAGFKEQLTGSENIFIKGALLGKTKEQMLEVYDEIVEFSEIGDFIDSPIKNYSSGMKARLGFAVAVHIRPDILLLDEVLAVGDFKFQQKCLAKVNEMRHEMTVLFVSHSLNSIRLFCDSALVLSRGQVRKIGTPDECIKYYLEHEESTHFQKPLDSNSKIDKNHMGNFVLDETRIKDVVATWSKPKYSLNEAIELILEIEFATYYKNLVIGIPIWNKNKVLVTALNSDKSDIEFSSNKLKQKIVVSFPCYFNPGEYDPVLAIVDNNQYIYRQPIPSFFIRDATRVYGYVTLPLTWRLHE